MIMNEFGEHICLVREFTLCGDFNGDTMTQTTSGEYAVVFLETVGDGGSGKRY